MTKSPFACWPAEAERCVKTRVGVYFTAACVRFRLSVRLQGISLFIVSGVKAHTETLQLQKGVFFFHSPTNPPAISDTSQPPNPISAALPPHVLPSY